MEILADISLWAIAVAGAAALLAVAFAVLRSWQCRDKSSRVEMNIPRHRIGIGVALFLVVTLIVTFLAERRDYVGMIIDTMAVMTVAAIVAALYGWTRLMRHKEKGTEQ